MIWKHVSGYKVNSADGIKVATVLRTLKWCNCYSVTDLLIYVSF